MAEPTPTPPGRITAIVPTPAELVAIPTVFFVIGLVLFVLRIQARRSAKALALDDLFLSFAVLCGVGIWISNVVGVCYGVGKHHDGIPQSIAKPFIQWLVVQGRLYAYGISFLKIGIAWQLMRLKGVSSISWRIGLWAMIAGIIAVFIISEVLFWLQVRPFDAFWNPAAAAHAKFLPDKALYGWSNAYSAWNLFSDVVFAPSPILFIRKMNQPRREKVILCMLFALGLLCSICSIPRFIVLSYPMEYDPSYEQAGIAMWSLLEYFVGIIAMCVLALRSRFESVLRAMGLSAHAASWETGRGPCSDDPHARNLWGWEQYETSRGRTMDASGYPRIGVLPTPERMGSETSQVLKEEEPTATGVKGDEIHVERKEEIV